MIFIDFCLTFKLPVSILSFDAQKANGKNELVWKVAQETDFNYYEVERSIDGINFSDAALVFAYGNTTAKSDYAFADNISKLLSGAVYYRIISISTDGRNLSSDVRMIKMNK